MYATVQKEGALSNLHVSNKNATDSLSGGKAENPTEIMFFRICEAGSAAYV